MWVESRGIDESPGIEFVPNVIWLTLQIFFQKVGVNVPAYASLWKIAYTTDLNAIRFSDAR